MATTTGLSEDDIYRQSSQYRLWSFSPERLAALRRKTHELAIERIQSQRKGDNGNSFLNEEEELRLVQRYCEQIRATSDHFKWPVNVKATAVQYLRRFYLSNSVMTYPPKEIYKTALFLACKTEATHMTLSEYARRISSRPEEILAPEYKLMQALRFTLDIRQPYRGLKGVLMELFNMADGIPQLAYQENLFKLETPSKSSSTQWSAPRTGVTEVKQAQDRIQAAYSAARAILDNQALMTDVYFLYTPAQALHAALHFADPELATFYLSTKLADNDLQAKIMSTIHGCADMLRTFTKASVLTKDERAALEEQLELCRDNTTRNLVENHLAKKIGEDDTSKAERRQAEREKNEREGEDLFGPSLKTNGTTRGQG